MTTYLGINMSGRNINVVNSNGGKIGTLFPKERFTYSFNIRTINGKKHKQIWFLNSKGDFVSGYILDSDPIQNWMNYRFYDSKYGYHFKVDKATPIFTIDGYQLTSIGPGSIVIPVSNAVSGNTKKHLLKVSKIIEKKGSSEYHHPTAEFIDTQINISPSNTPVYGNWN